MQVHSKQAWLVFFLLLTSSVARAQEDGLEDEFALLQEELSSDEITSASKYRQSVLWSPSAVTVFTREDILASGAASLPDLLRRVPGFDIFTVKPGYTLVGARALTAQNNNLVLLLVDGREELLDLTGFAFWENLSFVLEDVERVEVVRGPGSALYGANAVAAVVSVTTMRGRQAGRGYFTATLGERLRSETAFRLRDSFNLGDGELSYSLGMAYVHGRPPSDPGTLDLAALRTQNYLRYRRSNNLDLSLHAGGFFGGATIYLFSGDTEAEKVRTPWVMGKGEIALGSSSRLKAQIYYYQLATELRFRAPLRAYGEWIADLPRLSWVSHTADGQVHFEKPDLLGSDELLLIAGANLRTSTLAGSGIRLHDDSELRGALFVHLQWEPHRIIQMVAGARLDLNDLTEPALSPRAALVLRPWPNQSFRTGYGLAFRKPCFIEMLMHINITNNNPAFPEIVDIMSEQVGNPDLDNTKLHSIELGWQGRFLEERLHLSLDLYYSIYRSTIWFVSDVPLRLGLPDLRRANISFVNGFYDANALGGEAQVIIHPSTDWSFWCNLGIRQVDYLDPRARSITEEPTIRVNFGGRYLPGSGPYADVSVHYVSTYKRYLADPEELLVIRQPWPLGDRMLLVGRLGYKVLLREDMSLEAGLVVRTPIGDPFWEFKGNPMPLYLQQESAADFGGEKLVRQVAGYLRGWF